MIWSSEEKLNADTVVWTKPFPLSSEQCYYIPVSCNCKMLSLYCAPCLDFVLQISFHSHSRGREAADKKLLVDVISSNTKANTFSLSSCPKASYLHYPTVCQLTIISTGAEVCSFFTNIEAPCSSRWPTSALLGWCLCPCVHWDPYTL